MVVFELRPTLIEALAALHRGALGAAPFLSIDMVFATKDESMNIDEFWPWNLYEIWEQGSRRRCERTRDGQFYKAPVCQSIS